MYMYLQNILEKYVSMEKMIYICIYEYIYICRLMACMHL